MQTPTLAQKLNILQKQASLYYYLTDILEGENTNHSSERITEKKVHMYMKTKTNYKRLKINSSIMVGGQRRWSETGYYTYLKH